ncbi:Glyoxalase-like domain protein [Elizabethkingia miricola]|uniref:VOC family protein n=1 Tax=Elizabethkingia anophelis TaxID=1117645 RepID=UPI0005D91740|nr:VOC family protein [Elizabethkingia anophelis]AJW63191.1 Glyoxalase-like domain protein [Elizabethkingia miricola]MCT4322067.1 VOC family protein [Elizabethkingia anophelis]HAY3534644.1 VOC family protein [Elizabethkingia anophelis]HAY3546760.1 VOC family protein [Elizabethkingia anophelis]HAY3591548.1 VOC family protein [Elizabethkingia anophelis]
MSKTNPVVYFEIPVNDLQRAVKFYSAIFNFTFEKEIMDGYEMAFFPFTESKSGVTGALVKGDVYKPTKNGVILYFKNTLKKVLEYDGSILYPKTLNEKFGFAVAEFEDSEGNRIALHQNL